MTPKCLSKGPCAWESHGFLGGKQTSGASQAVIRALYCACLFIVRPGLKAERTVYMRSTCTRRSAATSKYVRRPDRLRNVLKQACKLKGIRSLSG